MQLKHATTIDAVHTSVISIVGVADGSAHI